LYTTKNTDFELKCVVSTVNGEKYCIRDREKLEEASDLLAKTVDKLNSVISFLKENYGEDERTTRLVNGFDSKKITEILPTSVHTAYSEDKGKKTAFCLTRNSKSEKDNNNLIDEETLTFVALHELSHVCTVSVGHEEEFWENFRWVLEKAKEAGVHNPVDYEKKPTKYCGMKIISNPYFERESVK
jgi:predicted metal-dependent hydrolase